MHTRSRKKSIQFSFCTFGHHCDCHQNWLHESVKTPLSEHSSLHRLMKVLTLAEKQTKKQKMMKNNNWIQTNIHKVTTTEKKGERKYRTICFTNTFIVHQGHRTKIVHMTNCVDITSSINTCSSIRYSTWLLASNQPTSLTITTATSLMLYVTLNIILQGEKNNIPTKKRKKKNLVHVLPSF